MSGWRVSFDTCLQELGCSLGALMLGLAGYESILLFQRAAFIDLISLVFVFYVCGFN